MTFNAKNALLGHRGQVTASLRSCEYSKNDELCMNKIQYKAIVLYWNYKNNVYKVENLKEKSSRLSKTNKNLTR